MRCDLYYRVSDTIVAEHPDLAEEVRALDGFLRDNRGETIRAERVADHLDIEANLLKRLFLLYERAGSLRRTEIHICPACDHALGEKLECDLCERRFVASEAPHEIGYQPADLGTPDGVPVQEDRAPAMSVSTIHDLLSPHVRNATINIGEVHVGDKYTAGQAGAMGPGAHATNMTFQQIWNQFGQGINLEALSSELEKLRAAMKADSTTPEHEVALAEVAKAQQAAQKKDGPGIIRHLKAAGKWAFDVSTKIGTALATVALKAALGMPG